MAVNLVSEEGFYDWLNYPWPIPSDPPGFATAIRPKRGSLIRASKIDEILGLLQGGVTLDPPPASGRLLRKVSTLATPTLLGVTTLLKRGVVFGPEVVTSASNWAEVYATQTEVSGLPVTRGGNYSPLGLLSFNPIDTFYDPAAVPSLGYDWRQGIINELLASSNTPFTYSQGPKTYPLWAPQPGPDNTSGSFSVISLNDMLIRAGGYYFVPATTSPIPMLIGGLSQTFPNKTPVVGQFVITGVASRGWSPVSSKTYTNVVAGAQLIREFSHILEVPSGVTANGRGPGVYVLPGNTQTINWTWTG